MSAVPPLAAIPVGILVERSKGSTQWAEFYWKPSGVLTGVPETAPWTKLSDDGERVTFYAGATDIELYRTETTYYRDNLRLETPLLWVILRPTESDPPYELAAVTADPAEGEAMTESGTNLVDTVPMPQSIQDALAAFVAQHHVEEAAFVKRKRDRANSDITAFLQPGVPSELKHAALRRAWVADPAIRDFIGPAEYAWDFTNPDAMPGFSGLGPGDDVKKLVAEVFRDATSAPEAKTPAPPSAQPTTPPDKIAANLQADEATGVDDKNLVQRDNNIASQEEESESSVSQTKVRRHGSAMPE